MSCTDCAAARELPEYQVFNPACLYCGARYLQTLKSWPPPRRIADDSPAGSHKETTAERQEWRAHVLKTWAGCGHDPARVKELAAGEVIPFAPRRG